MTSSGTLTGKVALVSGAGRGIGRAVAERLALAGARIVINDMDEEPAEQAAQAVREAGSEALTCVGSVTETDFAERFVATAVDGFGGLDIVVNNAGYTWDSVIQKMTDEQWNAVIDVHLGAPFRILRAALPFIKAAAKAEGEAAERPPHRKVVNISSLAGLGGNAGQSNYAAAKAGVVGLTKTLAKEWGRYRVNVNAVAFGMISTRLTDDHDRPGAWIEAEGRRVRVGIPADVIAGAAGLIPLGRAGTPAEAAGAVYLLCTPDADYVTGEVLSCGGGLAL
ncbi:SDR family NAD(P)-dependent oxidoreductase [Spongiactinospora sp. TRM90649]|uniref:SDR family NAD(P)-dependent oxidoreductase n=1 Tax=Spongiactinospora sp. TRM90649 TaxID=3031114 RepID=UPI0023F7BA55|nr:SDR family NAD(P)-dependent oxidoreductase [Spongiactinospora sp. TRM90649]MDF5752153.1 SDR family oxidoreductase [Spongiactinospora sp. TRM90649]